LSSCPSTLTAMATAANGQYIFAVFGEKHGNIRRNDYLGDERTTLIVYFRCGPASKSAKPTLHRFVHIGDCLKACCLAATLEVGIVAHCASTKSSEEDGDKMPGIDKDHFENWLHILLQPKFRNSSSGTCSVQSSTKPYDLIAQSLSFIRNCPQYVRIVAILETMEIPRKVCGWRTLRDLCR